MNEFKILLFVLLFFFPKEHLAGEIYGTVKIDGILKGGIEVNICSDKNCTNSYGSVKTDANGFYKISTDNEGPCYVNVCTDNNNCESIEIYVYADEPVRYDLNFDSNKNDLEVK